MFTSYLDHFFQRYPYSLSTLAAALLILTVPPVDLAAVVCIALVPLYIAILRAPTGSSVIVHGVIFGGVFSGYVTYVVLAGFHWFADAALFVWFMYGVGVMIVLVSTGISVAWLYVVWRVFQRYRSAWVRIGMFTTYALVDTALVAALYGFHYGSLQYAVPALDSLVWAIGYVPVVVVIIGLVGVNACLAEVMLRARAALVLASVALVGVLVAGPFTPRIPMGTTAMTVAIIQDDERTEADIFGRVVDGEYTFPRLAAQVSEAAAAEPDVIVYPFNPWTGVMQEAGETVAFDRDVVAVTDEQFTSWVAQTVPDGVVFVTWYTVYRSGQFFNEIGYWYQGEQIGAYQKQALFPFFDYTPAWAQQIGLFSTPFDGSAGDGRVVTGPEGVRFGSLICSEVGSAPVVADMATRSDIVFAIGSEAMFSHEFPARYNYMVAHMHARTHAVPVVRATKLGPSGIFLPSGAVVAMRSYGDTGIVVGDIPIP